ncbi:LytR/AlgR family response regulator transcription factor [Parabacteroides hominis]|uniref:Response regulator transcription factor n=1 Tax=Parabacteroides hominis TaxID=2763057 RepID=A0ABR7DUC4_9BACT|nr:LytTR family DNA-binding domain-containing protein [Parabacteroides hominis]MBC5635053.1 response regulator transcription factor [Parabacteroides hominis]
MIRCITIDDEPLALIQLTGYIEKVPFLKLVKACNSALEALDLLAKDPVDLIFADINMPDLNGVDFVKSLVNKPIIIFTTAYTEYAIEGFRVNALDYLLKPFGYNEFLKAANKALHQYELQAKIQQHPLPASPEVPAENGNNNLFIKADYKMIRLDMNKIIYMESQNEYIRIFFEDQKPVMTLLSMKKLEERLPAERFMRVHRSYIVNLEKITAVANNRIIYGKDTYIPIGNQYKDKFNEYLEKHYLGKL